MRNKRAVQGTTILSDGKGHFGPTDFNDRTGQSGPPLRCPRYSGRTEPKWTVPFDF